MAVQYDAHNPPFDDDDDMPPLVDNPPASMTFTFAANMTPIAYSTDQNSFELSAEAPAPSQFIYTPMQTESDEDTARSTHSKRKDAGYIPRPPNAFILFRSSFIRAQHIPEKIEGNHSALSKIIGKYWKSLPRSEREVWETKAIAALADHRKKYPDWRFRPAANALAKVKDGPKRRTNKKGRGEAEKEKKGRNKERRCEKIAEMLVAGKTGADLEQAIQKYDCEASASMKVEEQGCGLFVMKMQEHYQATPASQASGHAVQPVQDAPQPIAPTIPSGSPQIPRADNRPASPPSPSDARFIMPLTSMFRRSSSAPASRDRVAEGEMPSTSVPYLGRRESLSSPSGDSPRTASAPPRVLRHEANSRVKNGLGMTNVATTRAPMNRLSALSAPSPIEREASFASSHWSDPLTTRSFEASTYSPSLPAFEPDVDDNASPVQSPMSAACDVFSEADAASVYYERVLDFPDAQRSPVFSPYSSLKDWAGDRGSKGVPTPYGALPGPFVVTPQTPSYYDPEGVMKDAFAAASYAHMGAWSPGSYPAPTYQWHDSSTYQCLEHYAEGLQDLNCRQGDTAQLFHYSPLTAN